MNYRIFGEERYLVDSFVDKIVARVVTTPSDFDYLTLYKMDFDEIDMFVNTPPFLLTEKLLILNQTGIFTKSNPDKESYAQLFSNLPDYMVVLAKEDSFDGRLAQSKAFIHESQKFDYQKPYKLVDWIIELAKEHGKTISKSAAEEMVSRLKPDMYGLRNELYKLIHQSEGNSITISLVEQMVVKDVSSPFYIFTQAVSDGQARKALDMLEEFKRNGDEPVALLTILASHFLDMCTAKTFLHDGVASVAKRMKIKNSYVAAKICERAERINWDKLEKGVKLLAEMDYAVKSGLADGYFALTKLILMLC